MKTALLFLSLGLAGLMGCENGNPINTDKVNRLGTKFDSAAGKLWDSTKKEGKDIGRKLKEKMDSIQLR